MRYGKPNLEAGLQELLAAGVSSIVILPLYPQYSAATTASCFDKISQLLQQSRLFLICVL